ncbi:MAG: Wzz/FepE/Etk N-terminal domain-containing protein [Anaerovoracaceae bacterium]|jgi:capsular polysaccharide biosynthesis protein
MSDIETNRYNKYGDQIAVDDGYTIQELIDIILSHIKLILLITVLSGVLAFSVSQFGLTPYYESSVKLFVNNSRIGQADTTSISDLNASERLVNTYMEIVKSNTVLQKVSDSSGTGHSVAQLKQMVSTQSVKNTEIFYVTVTSDDPAGAQKLANQIAKDAPAEIMDFVEATSVKVIDYATLPTEPSTPNVKLNTAIGFLLGLILSVLLVLLLDMLDVTIRSEEDLTKLVDIPVLGVIPTIDMLDSKANGYGKRAGYRSHYEY